MKATKDDKGQLFQHKNRYKYAEIFSINRVTGRNLQQVYGFFEPLTNFKLQTFTKNLRINFKSLQIVVELGVNYKRQKWRRCNPLK